MASAAEQLASSINLANFSKATELKKRLWFTLGALILFRFLSFVPIPGVDPAAMAALFDTQSGGVLNFSGFSYLCTATPFQATGYRQRAIVEGGLSFAASGSGRMELAIVYSNDAPVGSGFTQAINHVFVDFEPGRRIHVATTGVNGTTTLTGTQQVSLRIQRVLGTGNLADWTCSLQASVINDNAP